MRNLINVATLPDMDLPAEDLAVLHFDDGPAVGQGNVAALDGTRHVILPVEDIGWPLPDYVVTLKAENTFMVRAFGENERADDLPAICTLYVKISESVMTKDHVKRFKSNIIRGANYKEALT